MEISFKNKRVLVTGGGKGIGRDVCKKLVDCGAEVVALSRSQGPLDSLAKEYPSIKTVCLDIGADWHKTAAVVDSLGDFDCLVNNAAVAVVTPFVDIGPEEVDFQFNVNVRAVINVSQVVVRRMIKRGKGGSIVNISSTAAKIALRDHTIYCATKGALDSVTRVMAMELGSYNIRVNNVNPTVVLTDMGRNGGWSDPVKAADKKSKIPLGRFAEMDEVVNAIVFILSDASPMINAVSLPVDGGFLAC